MSAMVAEAHFLLYSLENRPTPTDVAYPFFSILLGEQSDIVLFFAERTRQRRRSYIGVIRQLPSSPPLFVALRGKFERALEIKNRAK